MKYCLSDIHGEYALFLKLLDTINFSNYDTMYVCGDMIDKGKSSIALLNCISKRPNIKCIIGNHEYEFLKYYTTIMQTSPNNFDEVLQELQSYFPDDDGTLTWDMIDWLEELPYFIEEQDFICVHAGAPLGRENKILPLKNALHEQLVYDRTFADESVKPVNSKCVIFGHTPTSYICGENKILKYPRTKPTFNGRRITDYYKIHLDTGTYLNGVLGCFCLDDCSTVYVCKN